MGERIELSDDLRSKLLDDPSSLPRELTVKGKKYSVEYPVASGFKAAVWKVRDEYGRSRAAKLAIYEDYEDRSYLLELTQAAKLEQYNEFAKFIDGGVTSVLLSGKLYKFICFIEEWIYGETLDDFLKSNKNEISVPFFLSYVESICKALAALKSTSLRHDDMHSKNVMVARPPEGEIKQELAFKIIDTGSLKSLDTPTKKAKDDHQHFVEHLIHIWNVISSKKTLSHRDRRFLAQAKTIFNSMLDSDPAMALRDPRQIIKQFRHINTRSDLHQFADGPFNLLSPFEYISAEHISDDRLLLEFFAQSCPWLEKVSGPDPCLVTGPRGCGKSTIFRWLSLKPHLHKPSDELKSFRIIGFYLSCSTNIQNRLGWISSKALAERYRREIIHYFNMLLAKEVILSLEQITMQENRESLWGLGDNEERDLYAFLKGAINPSGKSRVQGVSRLAQAREFIEYELFITHDMIRRGGTKTQTTSEAFLGDLTSLLASKMQIFNDKKITFLLDDFSVHRVPEAVQEVLNPIIWERRATHIFKLSSEKYGAKLLSINNATADITREMIEIDCGREFIALDDAQGRKKAHKFTVDLLNHRLKAAGYSATAEQLIGHSPRESLAKDLVSSVGERHSGCYYGLERIADLCSGDISHLLLVFRRIFDQGGVRPDSQECVKSWVQDKCIKEVSRELFDNVRAYFPYGSEMYNIVAAFGNLVRNILEHGKLQTNGSPTQCPRIEIDQAEGGAIDTLGSTQQEIAKELIRRAIFVDMLPGTSRHGNVTTLRWNLRRIYLPSFGAALTKNDAVKDTHDWFKFFIISPAEACNMIWNRWPKKDQTSPADSSKNPQLAIPFR